jgi:hypothetical protein
MKKLYIEPSIEIVEAYGGYILNSGSVVTYDGKHVDGLGDGGTGGTSGSDNTIWGDAKKNTNLWDDSDE